MVQSRITAPGLLALCFASTGVCHACGATPQAPPASPGATSAEQGQPVRVEPVATVEQINEETAAQPMDEPGPSTWDAEWNDLPLCEALMLQRLKLVGEVPPVADHGGGGFEVKEFLEQTCEPVPKGGAWAIYLGSVQVTSSSVGGLQTPDSASGEWTVARVDARGKGAHSPAQSFDASTMHSVGVGLRTFDYDGDGEPEAIVEIGRSEHNGTGSRTAQIWTYKAGRVTRYAPAQGLHPVTAEDVDEDGRPDLLYTHPYTGDVSLPMNAPFDTSMAGRYLLAAHSLPDGTFSVDDQAALDHARYECSQRPGRIFVGDESEALDNVRCARLRGVDEARVVREIETNCKTKWDGSIPPVPGTCALRKKMLEWARAQPPLLLR